VIAYHQILGKLGTPMFWMIASTGTILLLATALTITKMPRAHLGLSYVIWLAFVVALGSNTMKRPMVDGPFLALVVLGMVIHAANAVRTRKIASAASA
jgi:succinate dehydrogenase hydrophobic anchor subunit